MMPFSPTESELRAIYATLAKSADPDTPEGRQEMLRRGRQAVGIYYSLSSFTGVHALLEFTGPMSEFLNICSDAEEQGLNWCHANVHTGIRLPIQRYHVAYLREKLQCIYADDLELLIGEDARAWREMLERKHGPLRK
jgi:hypothetical protein